MPPLNRRSFLAGAAALASAPRQASAQSPGEVDIAIVGAGAAGIAAARRVAAANRRFALIEAAERIGGRCVTDTRLFGMPFDLGAHWIHTPEVNPLTKLAAATGLDVYPAPPGQKIRIGRRYARESELEDFLAVLVRANRAIGDAVARGRTDISCAQALPQDLGDWRGTVEFVLGPFSCGKDLSEVSAVDFAKSAEREANAFCRQGLGALLAKLAEGLPVRLSSPVTRIATAPRGLAVETAQGRIMARAVIVTASTNVLAAGKIKFEPELPRRHVDALSRLRLGSYDHIALEVAGAPFGPQADELIYEKSGNPRTAAMLANISGTPLCVVDVAGKFGRELAAKGEKAMVEFALEWLSELYGPESRRSVQRVYATRWNEQPFALGAFSVATPGAQWARSALMEPVRGRIWFAGEAAHETLWGTVGGAWLSGDRAATVALRALGLITTPREAEPPPPSRSSRSPSRRRPSPEAQPWAPRILAPERY